MKREQEKTELINNKWKSSPEGEVKKSWIEQMEIYKKKMQEWHARQEEFDDVLPEIKAYLLDRNELKRFVNAVGGNLKWKTNDSGGLDIWGGNPEYPEFKLFNHYFSVAHDCDLVHGQGLVSKREDGSYLIGIDCPGFAKTISEEIASVLTSYVRKELLSDLLYCIIGGSFAPDPFSPNPFSTCFATFLSFQLAEKSKNNNKRLALDIEPTEEQHRSEA